MTYVKIENYNSDDFTGYIRAERKMSIGLMGEEIDGVVYLMPMDGETIHGKDPIYEITEHNKKKGTAVAQIILDQKKVHDITERLHEEFMSENIEDDL